MDDKKIRIAQEFIHLSLLEARPTDNEALGISNELDPQRIFQYHEEIISDLLGIEGVEKRTFLGKHDRLPRVYVPIVHTIQRESPDNYQAEQAVRISKTLNAVTRKPSNIVINWRSFLGNIPDGALMIAGAASSSWLMVLAGLSLARKIFFLQDLALSTNHAALLTVLAASYGFEIGATENDLKEATNHHLEKFHRLPIDDHLFARVVDELCSCKCIYLRNGLIFLQEKVTVDFDFPESVGPYRTFV